MKLHVAHNSEGRILAAAVEEGDQPATMPGVTVTELEVPAEFGNADPTEFLHLLHVDVKERKLIRRHQG
jgi:hypothetical protein